MSELLITGRLDMKSVIDGFVANGAVSIPIIGEEVRTKVLREVRKGYYMDIPELLTAWREDQPYMIHQQLEQTEVPSDEGLLGALMTEFKATLDEALKTFQPGVDYPFASPFVFNKYGLINRYPAGSIGMSPHVDHQSFVNMVAVFVIDGQGRFFVCDDIERNNSVEIDATPGNVILMRAPGFLPRDGQQWHYVTNITTERYVLSLRQKGIV